MTAKVESAKSRASKRTSLSEVEQCIRRRAYEIYEQRGRIDGLDFDDWLQAETEMLGANPQRKRKAARGSAC